MKIFCYSAQLKELQNKTLNIIFNIHFRSHVWLVWFPFQSFSSYLARAVDYAQKTKWTIEGLGKKVIAPENNIVDMEDWFENIVKGTTDPGVDYFNQLLWFGLAGLVL